MTLPIALALAALAAPLAAQRAPPARSYPVTSPVRHAGTVDVTTGRWTRPASAPKSCGLRIFDNTCTWESGAYYSALDWCEEVYDEGRLPSPSDPQAPTGASASNAIASIEISYCTAVGPLAATGGYDMDLAFWDKLGGDCVGGVPPTPPPVSTTATAYLPLAGLGLPGSTAPGVLACWLVTLDTSNAPIVLASDGEGTFDGVAAEDKFIWMQRQNQTQPPFQYATPDGFLLAGDPCVTPFGACSYDIPCGTDPFSGEPCGTGLDGYDTFWINVDGIGVGASGQPAGCANSVSQYGFGTNCYFLGGCPGTPFFGVRLVLHGQSSADPLAFCVQTKATSVPGCMASLSVTDVSLATGAWCANDIPRQAGLGDGDVLGVFVYEDGVGIGQSTISVTVSFGTLCLAGFKRSSPACSPAILHGAQAGACNAGPMLTAVNCNTGALGVAVGEDLNVQLWYRDPGAAGNANFSNAIFYTVQ